MKKVSRKEQLEDAITDLYIAKAFLMSDKVKIVMNQLGKDYAITKEVGSDLCYLFNAINKLEAIADKRLVTRV